MNIQLKRNTNQGYKPFYIDLTFDACKFMKNQKNIFVNLFYTHLRKASNINHTCPYNVSIMEFLILPHFHNILLIFGTGGYHCG